MRPIRVILVYALTVFVGGALLAPAVYGLVQKLAVSIPSLHGLADAPFRRYVTRCLLFLALTLLVPFVRAAGIRSWKELGLTGVKDKWPRWRKGFELGFLSLASVAVLTVIFGEREIIRDRSSAMVLRHLINAVSAAVLVSILEEVLFRGGIYGTLRRVHRWPVALFMGSALFAILHFLDQRPPAPERVEWYSGLVILPQMIRGFGDLHQLVPGFLNLTLAGGILAYAFQRSGNLYFSIGLHAGWIFWLKSYGFITRPKPGSDLWLWGSNRMIDGWLSFGVLVVTWLVVHRVTREPKPPMLPKDTLDEVAEGNR